MQLKMKDVYWSQLRPGQDVSLSQSDHCILGPTMPHANSTQWVPQVFSQA